MQSQAKTSSGGSRAEDRGMKVNSTKMAVLCISDAMSYKARAFINDADGNLLEHLNSKDGTTVGDLLTVYVGVLRKDGVLKANPARV